MTLLRNGDGTLPLTARSRTSRTSRSVLVTGYGVTSSATLAADIAARGATVTRVYTGSAPSTAAMDAAVAAARTVDDVVVISNDAWGDPGQRELITRLQATRTPTIVLATGAPYELGYLPSTPTFVASYSYQPAALQAATDVLFGAQPQGRTPVTIRTPDGATVIARRGFGLTLRGRASTR